MVATTDQQKARLLDLATGVLELVRDGKRDAGQVSDVLQIVKDDPSFAMRFVAEGTGTQPLLIPIGTAAIPATSDPFFARDHFVVNTAEDAPVKISFLGDNFKAWFPDKEEPLFGGSTLRYGKLARSSMDSPILAALGGETKAETTLTELHALLKAQRNGENGPLLTNGYANIFYIKDVNGVLRAVGADWDGDGWCVYADAVTSPNAWGGGYQVFSRHSVN